ncbi:hypothetical protein [Oscillibacter sp.]|uniref:hypothetical protein n=1 Tax=Oscillibacter sp. TaxID=1945593 RepID=UPI00289F1D0F|nr:hypothetical protein [Oscillibacter sp.]
MVWMIRVRRASGTLTPEALFTLPRGEPAAILSVLCACRFNVLAQTHNSIIFVRNQHLFFNYALIFCLLSRCIGSVLARYGGSVLSCGHFKRKYLPMFGKIDVPQGKVD